MPDPRLTPERLSQLRQEVRHELSRDKLIEYVGLLVDEIEELRAAQAEAERHQLELIDRHDELESLVGDLAADAGCEDEWSNTHRHGQCIRDALSTRGDGEEEAKFVPIWASPPGNTIQSWLDNLNWSSYELAERLGMESAQEVHRLLTGELAITPNLACQLSSVIGSTPRFWLNREAQYRESLARIEMKGLLPDGSPRRGKGPGVGTEWTQKPGYGDFRVVEVTRRQEAVRVLVESLDGSGHQLHFADWEEQLSSGRVKPLEERS